MKAITSNQAKQKLDEIISYVMIKVNKLF